MNWKDWSDGYNGKTLLQDWWKAVKTNFGLVKDNITELKGEVDKKAETEVMTAELAKKANAQTAYGGFAAGRTAGATSGVAVGNNAYSGGKGASLGGETYSQLGGAVGYKAETDNGFAGGYNARTAETIDVGNGATNYSRITAVQLGEGLNSKRYTAQIFDYELVADDAEIPTESDGSKYLKDVGKLSDLQTEVKTDIVGAVNGIAEELTEKVDKESGKGLSTIENISVMHSTYIGADGSEKDNPYATMTINRQNGKSNVEKIITHAHRETFDHPDGSVTEKKLSSELAEKINGKQDNLTFDSEPTADSTNSVTSGVIKSALDGKADKQNGNGGFAAGTVAYVGTGGAIGSCAHADSGFAGGQSAEAVNGGAAVGNSARIENGSGGAVGGNACAENGGSIGHCAQAVNGGAVGEMAQTGDGFAGGKDAKTTDSYHRGINAIQLGSGNNANAFTAQIYDYELIANDSEAKSAVDGGKYLKDVGKLSSLATSVKDNMVNAVNSVVAAHNDLKLKSVPHKDVSAYPVTLTDHLADEEFIKCNIYGSTDGVGNLDSADGKYKIPIITREKNLFNFGTTQKNWYIHDNTSSTSINTNDCVVSGKFGDGASNWVLNLNKIPVTTGKKYVVSYNSNFEASRALIRLLDINGNILTTGLSTGIYNSHYNAYLINNTAASNNDRVKATFSVTNDNVYYILIGMVFMNQKDETMIQTFSKIQFELGEAATEYEDYTENTVTAVLDTALTAGEYIDIVNKKRYNGDAVIDITVSGSLKTTDSAKNHISCGITEAPSKIELSYWQDINKVISETTNAILAQGGNI